MTAPALEKDPSFINPVPGIVGRPTRVYNPATTILQAVGVGAGLHLTRHGILSDLSLTLQRYEDVATKRNRDYFTWNIMGRTLNSGLGGQNYENSYNRLLNLANDAFYFNDNLTTDPLTWRYLYAGGGPNSVYGLGNTTHKRYENTKAAEIPKVGTHNYIATPHKNRMQAILDRETHPIVDFRVYKKQESVGPGYSDGDTYRSGIDGNFIDLARKYGFEKSTVDQMINPNDPKTVIPESIGTDTVDELGVVNSDRSGDNTDSMPMSVLEGAYDLIPLVFRDINGSSNIMQFRCTLESITDTFSPEWDSTSYMGRAEPVWHYKGAAARKVSSGFTTYAVNRKSLRSMYQKLNRLAGYTMPKYESGNFNQMSAPLMKLTIGDYIKNQPGFLSSLSFNIENDVYWETTQEVSADGRVQTYKVPRSIKVDFEYTIIEKDLVQRYKSNFGTKDWLDRV
jgi:hypothetical protein